MNRRAPLRISNTDKNTLGSMKPYGPTKNGCYQFLRNKLRAVLFKRTIPIYFIRNCHNYDINKDHKSNRIFI